MCLLANEDVDLYLAIGDELKRLRDRYHHTIGELKLICKNKLAAYAEFQKRIDKLSVEQRQKAMAKLGRDFYKVSRLITYLEKARKATGQYKFRLYDMEMPRSKKRDNRFDEAHGFENPDFGYHYENLECLLGLVINGEQEPLDGMVAEIAGRIVLPMISGGLTNPRAQFLKLDERYNFTLQLLELPVNPEHQGRISVQRAQSVQSVHRSKRFIAALNRPMTTLK